MKEIKISKTEFISLAGKYNRVPVYGVINGDLHTAISLFLKTREGRYQFLLESSVSGKYPGRYSFMGNSGSGISCRDGIVKLINSSGEEEVTGVEPFDYLRDYVKKVKACNEKGLPPFMNGIVGYFGYDTIQYFEDIDFNTKKGEDFNDFELIIADEVLIYDHLTNRLYISITPELKSAADYGMLYDESVFKIKKIIEAVNGPEKESVGMSVARKGKDISYKSNFSKKGFEDCIRKIKDYIGKGEIFQLVLSQRLSVEIQGDAFNIYRNLRIINPSPYMFYLKMGSIEIIGSSPEIHVQLENGRARVKPIAGTRPRGKNAEEDSINENELLNDEKELAEHLMLIDLGRNDIGKVCKGGTVKVDSFKEIEYYSHVMHIVSSVSGELEEGRDTFDLIRATFPAGTVSGAPKIRAMEIINELEPERRGVYSGIVGYFSYDNDFDSCITIRTIVVKNNIAFLQAGAGIVADSVPEREYYETIHKMKALAKAIEAAGE